MMTIEKKRIPDYFSAKIEEQLLLLAKQYQDPKLNKLILNVCNRNKILNERNARLARGNTAHVGTEEYYRTQRDYIAKLSRKAARQMNIMCLQIPDDKAGNNLKRKAQKMIDNIENFMQSNGLTAAFKKG